MLLLDNNQIKTIGLGAYALRMRKYLNDAFEDSKQVPAQKMEETIIKMTKQAAIYNMTLETDLAAYISAAWLLGLDFDTKFLTVNKTLQSDNLSGIEKAEFLWQFIEDSFEILNEE